MKAQKKHEFWITNISQNRDISLGDLRLTIRSGESRNLLDSKHYSYTLDELQKSSESGSIKAKSRFIKVREIKPLPIAKPGIYLSNIGRGGGVLRNKVEIVIPTYEELDGVEQREVQERFAADEADIVEEDAKPALAVDIKYIQNKGDE